MPTEGKTVQVGNGLPGTERTRDSAPGKTGQGTDQVSRVLWGKYWELGGF